MNKLRNPNEKFITFQKIIKIQQIITTKISKTTKDDELLVLEYLIINAKPQMLNSNVNFVRIYKDFIDYQSEDFYEKTLIDYEGIISLSGS